MCAAKILKIDAQSHLELCKTVTLHALEFITLTWLIKLQV